ncbi:M20/M25/M40 family metallo-hydrolase [Glaciibacter psychrotolerans]|uniref:Carboxypeptidase PM20D1 n=1 Tax=Glaciibacter psychrotolerans TaxID=670054 RepID=A0A7Z0J6I9_9MICO|nr:M20/M25/M40 family metallo-hydrolase [Leifsonia psychrotolerans]NYJ19999.1 carboxypeptidase PM20D1 [Leifsonia psychrotolerans]
MNPHAQRPAVAWTLDDAQAVSRFQALLRIPTMSRLDESDTDWAQFDSFIAALCDHYPASHEVLERELVAGHSLLYRWPGATAENPTVLMAHYDVVPATDDGWTHPPFAAELVDDGNEKQIWGRGTLDDKGALVAILEAVESMVAAGFQPAHDIYLSFGHNEETTGQGACAIVDLLQARGIRPALVIDEGGAVVTGIFPGVKAPIAVVGVSEKGITSVLLTVNQSGGHASTPPRMTATVRLARAITRVNSNRFPARFTDTNFEMIHTLGAHSSGPLRFIFMHARAFRLPLGALFGRLSDETSAMVRTTTAVTQLSGAQAANALPEQAKAVVNVRIAQGSTVAATLHHIRRSVRDPLVEISIEHPNEPSNVSPTTGPAWDLVRESVEATYPGTIVTPYVMLGASDSRHFTRISDHVYRFSPFEMSRDERGTLHAMNERIGVGTFLRGIEFFQRVIAAR